MRSTWNTSICRWARRSIVYWCAASWSINGRRVIVFPPALWAAIPRRGAASKECPMQRIQRRLITWKFASFAHIEAQRIETLITLRQTGRAALLQPSPCTRLATDEGDRPSRMPQADGLLALGRASLYRNRLLHQNVRGFGSID